MFSVQNDATCSLYTRKPVHRLENFPLTPKTSIRCVKDTIWLSYDSSYDSQIVSLTYLIDVLGVTGKFSSRWTGFLITNIM
jgi:hypothetical protein